MGTGKEDEQKSFGWNEAKRRGKVAKQRKKIMLSRIREVIKKEIVYLTVRLIVKGQPLRSA